MCETKFLACYISMLYEIINVPGGALIAGQFKTNSWQYKRCKKERNRTERCNNKTVKKTKLSVFKTTIDSSIFFYCLVPVQGHGGQLEPTPVIYRRRQGTP